MKNKRVTLKQVKSRMKRMKIKGYSSMGKFTPTDMMGHLDVIQQILDERAETAIEELKRLKKETKYASEKLVKSLPNKIQLKKYRRKK